MSTLMLVGMIYSALYVDFKLFFSIDLGYLSVLRPALGWVIWTAAGFGTLGLSTQLCLIQDIISMLTLHIYCFYVYAARQEFYILFLNLFIKEESLKEMTICSIYTWGVSFFDF